MNRSIANLSYAILIASSVILFWGNYTVGHNWGGDFSAYIMQAISIVEGDMDLFVEANRFTIEASSKTLGPVTYPWGFPLLLAPVYYFAGFDIVAFKYFGLLFFVFFLLILSKDFKGLQGTFWRSAFIALFAVNPYFILFMNNVLSDIPFLFLSTLAVVLTGKNIVQKKQIWTPLVDGLILGLVIFIAYTIRSNGFILLAVLGLTQLVVVIADIFFKKGFLENNSIAGFATTLLNKQNKSTNRIRWIGLFSPYFTFILLLIAYYIIFPDESSSHFSLFSNISLKGLMGNAFYYFKLPADFFRSPIKYVNYILYIATLPLVAVTLIKRYKNDYHIIIYVGLTFALYIVWPAKVGLRFIFPILPFYVYYTILALESFESPSKDKIDSLLRLLLCRVPVLLIVGLGYFFLSFAAFQNIAAGRYYNEGPYTENAQQMFLHVQQNSLQNDVVVFFKPRPMRLFTNRPSILINRREDLVVGDVLVIDNTQDAKYQMAEEDLLFLENQGDLEKTWFNNQFVVYRINK